MSGPLRYSIVIQWSDEDQLFIASFPEFGSGASTHGASYEEAFKNALEVLDLLVEGEKELPEPWKYPSIEWPKEPQPKPALQKS
jgi:predicted RNase H-like HicB family nuclease